MSQANHVRRLLPGVRADFTDAQWDAMLIAHEYRCFYCGDPDRNLILEHKLPVRRGGAHTAGNIVPACVGCNIRKGNLTAEEFAPLVDPLVRAANLRKPSRLASAPEDRTPAPPWFWDAWALLDPSPAPIGIFASTRIGSDAKVLYALLSVRGATAPASGSPRALQELRDVGLVSESEGTLRARDSRDFLLAELKARGHYGE